MSERDAIDRTGESPVTAERLVDDLQRLGVTSGKTLLVHSSLSSLGWVCGGAVAVIDALKSAIGSGGTLVMPTHSADLSDPKHWNNPPVPRSWWQTIRDNMPTYDADLTPTRGMGRIPETFRKQAGVFRSDHPQFSFAARGPNARRLTADHQLESGLGERSPLSRFYSLRGWILLLGVDHSCNTSLHLSEHRAKTARRRTVRNGAPVNEEGTRRWREFEELELDASDFDRIGADFAAELGLVQQGRVGHADGLLMPQRELVDFAKVWMETHR
jgi:aminoglycoside 3-N-acetyltransferase